MQIQFRQIQDRASYLESEIDRLNKENKGLIKELDNWKYKYTEYSALE